MDAATFAADYWDHRPLLSRAEERGGSGFGDLISAAAVDSLATERGLRQPFFRLVRDGAGIPGVARAVTAGSRTITDLADPERIRQEYDAGATIVLQSLHRYWPPIADFCRRLAAELGHPAQCNAYVTPAGNARGFAFHHDTHDVFVLQVEGRKRWLVHEPVLELPTKSQPRSGSNLVPDAQRPIIDATLEPGDVLYLPRGFVHAAATTDMPSIHLTVGVHSTTWLDLLSDVVADLGPDELTWRRSLPAGPATDRDHEDVAAALVKQAATWLAGLPGEDVTAVIRRRAARTSAPEPVGVLAAVDAAHLLTETTPVRPRKGVDSALSRVGDRVTLRTLGKRIQMPAVAEGVLRALLTNPTTARAAVAGEPECSVDDAIVIVRRLVREGVLVPDR